MGQNWGATSMWPQKLPLLLNSQHPNESIGRTVYCTDLRNEEPTDSVFRGTSYCWKLRTAHVDILYFQLDKASQNNHTRQSQSQCINLHSASLATLPWCASCASTVRTKNVFCWRLKAASVEFGLRTETEKLFQADGPALANTRRPYVLSRWRGTCSRFRSAERRCLWLVSAGHSERRGTEVTGSSARHRWTMTTSLNVIRSRTWSRWSFLS